MDHSQISREQGFLSRLSQLHVAVVDFGFKLTCETAALSSLSSACSQAPGEVLDQDLVVAEICACYRSVWQLLSGAWVISLVGVEWAAAAASSATAGGFLHGQASAPTTVPVAHRW